MEVRELLQQNDNDGMIVNCGIGEDSWESLEV